MKEIKGKVKHIMPPRKLRGQKTGKITDSRFCSLTISYHLIFLYKVGLVFPTEVGSLVLWVNIYYLVTIQEDLSGEDLIHPICLMVQLGGISPV